MCKKRAVFLMSLAGARELEECVKNVPFFNVPLAGARELEECVKKRAVF